MNFYSHEGETGDFCKVGRDEEGSSSNRAEHAAACIALEDAIKYAGSQRPLILLTDSKCLLMAIQKWIGEGINPTIKESPDGDILREILDQLRVRIDLGEFTLFVKIKSHRGELFNQIADRWADKGRRIDLGVFTLFVKIKSHRGEFFNEIADRWADRGRHMETETRWTSLRQRPTFAWTASGIAHRSTMSKHQKNTLTIQ